MNMKTIHTYMIDLRKRYYEKTMKQPRALSTKCMIVVQNVNRAIRTWNGANKAIVIWGGILQF